MITAGPVIVQVVDGYLAFGRWYTGPDAHEFKIEKKYYVDLQTGAFIEFVEKKD